MGSYLTSNRILICSIDATPVLAYREKLYNFRVKEKRRLQELNLEAGERF